MLDLVEYLEAGWRRKKVAAAIRGEIHAVAEIPYKVEVPAMHENMIVGSIS